MKKLIKLKVLLFVVVLMVFAIFALTACDWFGNSDDDVEVFDLTDIQLNKVIPVENDTGFEYGESFSTGLVDVHYFRLGEVINVPVATLGMPVHHDGRSTTLQVERIETRETEVIETSERIIENVRQDSSSHRVRAYAEVSATIPVKIAMLTARTGVETEATTGTTVTRTTTQRNTFTNIQRWSETIRQNFYHPLGRGHRAGVYRLSIFATFDVFAIVIVDHDTQQMYYEFVTSSRENFFIGLDFCPRGNFNERLDTTRLQLPDAALDDLSNAVTPPTLRKFDLNELYEDEVETIVITSQMEDVVIIGEEGRTFDKNITINLRNRDLRIILVNTKLMALSRDGARNDGIQHRGGTSPHMVVIGLIGENSIEARNGANGSYHATDRVRRRGEDGGIAINLLGRNLLDEISLSVQGSGNLKLVGGHGGNGVNGPRTDSHERSYRGGGYGGNGGHAVMAHSVCFAFIRSVGLDENSGLIHLKGGNGGNGGNGGDSSAGWQFATGQRLNGGHGGGGGHGGFSIASHEPPNPPDRALTHRPL